MYVWCRVIRMRILHTDSAYVQYRPSGMMGQSTEVDDVNWATLGLNEKLLGGTLGRLGWPLGKGPLHRHPMHAAMPLSSDGHFSSIFEYVPSSSSLSLQITYSTTHSTQYSHYQ